jgi:U6 snRNA-associated Sm-like protein LSm8
MAQRLVSYVGKRVTVTDLDGRLIVGKLRGVDQFTNIVLENAEVLQLSSDAPPAALPLNSTVIRGDQIAMIGLIDAIQEASVQRSALRFPSS